MQPKTLGRAKYSDFERATAFDLGHRLSKHKTTRYVSNLEWAIGLPGYNYACGRDFSDIVVPVSNPIC